MKVKKKSGYTPPPWMAEWTGVEANIGRPNNVVGTIKTMAEADRIVRAVNSHEALLEAAKIGLQIGLDAGMEDSMDDALKKIRKAIAQAEGRI